MGDYFCGWYFKCQSKLQTMAVIPAMHKSQGQKSCSVQLITERDSWNIRFPFESFRKRKFDISIGENHFSRHGIRLKLEAPGLSAVGSVVFGPFTPIRYDIMGPFRYVPFMECRHSVLSMGHSVNREIRINGTAYTFFTKILVFL